MLGLGPLGAAFFMWDRPMKQGVARQIGILSDATPLLSASIALSAALILSATVMGKHAR